MEKDLREEDFEDLEMAMDGDMILEMVKDSGLDKLSIEERNFIFMDKNLSDRVREIVEDTERKKETSKVYKEITGDTEESFGKKVDLAKFVLAINDIVLLKLNKSDVTQIKVKTDDSRGRKPSIKLVNNLKRIFDGKMSLNKQNIIDELKNVGYMAEEVTLTLYINWSVSWSVLNIIGDRYTINKDVIREIYNL